MVAITLKRMKDTVEKMEADLERLNKEAEAFRWVIAYYEANPNEANTNDANPNEGESITELGKEIDRDIPKGERIDPDDMEDDEPKTGELIKLEREDKIKEAVKMLKGR